MPLVLAWMSRWPLWLLHDAGAALGWLAWALSPTYRRRLGENARRAGIGRHERRRAVAEAGRMVSELPRLWLRPHGQPIADTVLWPDHSPMDEWHRNPRGLLLLTPHLGSFEVAAQAYVERYGPRRTMTVLYRPAHKPWLRKLEETARARPGLLTAPATLAGVRQMRRALERGQTVGMLPDQVPPQGQGVWAPFFGQPAYTMTLAARLVRKTGASLGLLVAERLPRGQGWRMHVAPLSLPAVRDTAGSEAEAAATVADALAINQAMEQAIGLAPAQYLWGYHRYKQPAAAEAPAAAAVAGESA